MTSTVASLGVLLLIIGKGGASFSEALRLLGWWPLGFFEIIRCTLLTALLFAGPLFEKWAVGEWNETFESLSSWIAWRNYVAGPVSEEITFRSALIPLHLLARVSPERIVFFAPLYFGIAHVHHFYEFQLTHPGTPIMASLLRSLFQFAFTTVFGWYATFLFLRSGSLVAVIVVHSFCNYCGLPRLWGRLEVQDSPASGYFSASRLRGKEDDDSKPVDGGDSRDILTPLYYVILFAGAIAFYFQIWSLTESSHELVSF